MSVIVVDGPDAAGKTTLTSSLAQALQYVPIKTPPASFRARRAPYDVAGVSPLERFHFYAQGVKASCDEIAAAQSSHGGAVVDRYTYSLILHHAELDPTVDFAALADAYHFPLPSRTFILTADLSVLAERIARRDGQTDAALERNQEYLGRVLHRFRQANDLQTVHLDTSTATPARTLHCALEALR